MKVEIDTSALGERSSMEYFKVVEEAEKSLPPGHYKVFYNVRQEEFQFLPIAKVIKSGDKVRVPKSSC